MAPDTSPVKRADTSVLATTNGSGVFGRQSGRYPGEVMHLPTTTLVVVALSVLSGCTSLSGLDDKVFDLADAGDGQAGSGGSAGTGGSAGAGGDGGDGGAGGAGGGCTDQMVEFSDTTYGLVVPAGVSWLHAKAWGGGGNDECDTAGTGTGGVGGFTEAVFQVTPGDPLSVVVGKRKLPDPLTLEEQRAMGFPGVGAGGLSGVFSGGEMVVADDLLRALIIAGGGGGAGNYQGTCEPAGAGNAPVSGGQSGTMLGEDGSDLNSGGGGYEGGNAGDDQTVVPHAGFGGKGFVHSSARTPGVDPAFEQSGSHLPPGIDDDDWADGAGAPETPGRVVLRFYCSEPPPL